MRTPQPDAAVAGVPFAPPPGMQESVAACRAGHVWVPGFWDWKNDHHVWIAGHWVPARQGCHWRRHRWLSRDGRWFLESGGWVVDDVHRVRESCEQAR